MSDKKTRTLTPEEHTARISNGVCPRCGDYRLVRQVRFKGGDEGNPKFAGSYYTCGGPLAHQCYNITSEHGSRLSETTEGVDPIRLPKPSQVGAPRVVRRVKSPQ